MVSSVRTVNSSAEGGQTTKPRYRSRRQTLKAPRSTTSSRNQHDRPFDNEGLEGQEGLDEGQEGLEGL